MASSAEMLAGGLGLLVFTFVDAILYVVGSAIYGPLIKLFNEAKITPLLGFSDSSYIPYLFWAFLLLFEIMAIVAFVYIVGRRQVSGVYY